MPTPPVLSSECRSWTRNPEHRFGRPRPWAPLAAERHGVHRSQAAPATPVHDIRIESAQRSQHSEGGHAERQRGHLWEHPRRHPVHPDTVVKSLGAVFTWRRVGRDHQGFMTGSTQMFEYLDHRVADAVHLREERLGDDRNAHATHTVSAGCRNGCVAAYGVRTLLLSPLQTPNFHDVPTACPAPLARPARRRRSARPPPRWTRPG